MKKLKKLAALLLAGAMVMMLFTACGGSNIAGENTKEESNILSGFRTQYGVSAQSNDAALKQIDTAVVASINGHIIKDKFALDGINDPTKEYITITVVSNYDYNSTKLQNVLDLFDIVTPKVNVDVKGTSNWVNVGVVVKNVKGHNYVGVSIQIRNPKYNNK